MDLTGIENEAEIFRCGTLSDVLETELQDISGRWSRELEGNNPITRLSGIADNFIRSYRELLNTKDQQRRGKLYAQNIALVTKALGYTIEKFSEPTALETGTLARLTTKTFNADGKQALWIIETPVPTAGEEQADPQQSFDPNQFESDDRELAEVDKTIEELLSEGIFSLADAPRYLLIAGAHNGYWLTSANG